MPPPRKRLRSVDLAVTMRGPVALSSGRRWECDVGLRCVLPNLAGVVPTSPTSSDRVVLSRHKPSSAIRETVLGDPEGSWRPFRVAL